MKKNKKILIGMLSLGLVAVVGIGTTLSFLTDTTVSRVNNFTYPSGEKVISAKLTEPKWDGVIDYIYNADGSVKDPVYGWNGETPITVKPAGETYGIDKANNLLPGQSVDKNPIITNTGSYTDVWVASKITFVYSSTADVAKKGKTLSATDLAAVIDVLEIDYNIGSESNKWTRKTGENNTLLSQTFYYNGVLDNTTKAGGTKETTALFTTVKIKESATTEQLQKVADIGGYAIFIEGFCAQKDVASDSTAWLAGADGIVTFANTPTDTAPGKGYTPY
ncbi:MAG: hypothetical protein RR549_03095 [Oscillospiraceae bacterium]